VGEALHEFSGDLACMGECRRIVTQLGGALCWRTIATCPD
jgi:hypothetical protein